MNLTLNKTKFDDNGLHLCFETWDSLIHKPYTTETELVVDVNRSVSLDQNAKENFLNIVNGWRQSQKLPNLPDNVQIIFQQKKLKGT